MGIGDWGLGIGDWGLGIGPNPQSPIPNPQSLIPIKYTKHIFNSNKKSNYLNNKMEDKFGKTENYRILIRDKKGAYLLHPFKYLNKNILSIIN